MRSLNGRSFRKRKKKVAPPPASAVIAGGGRYRYDLRRHWGEAGAELNVCTWVMLNPSRADALVDDPTVRRVRGFAETWGFNALRIVNLFAYRMTDPKLLWTCKENIAGPMNKHYLRDAAQGAQRLVFAWGGARDSRMAAQVDALWSLCQATGSVRPLCLGVTREGAPKHPLYLRADTVPRGWAPALS